MIKDQERAGARACAEQAHMHEEFNYMMVWLMQRASPQRHTHGEGGTSQRANPIREWRRYWRAMARAWWRWRLQSGKSENAEHITSGNTNGAIHLAYAQQHTTHDCATSVNGAGRRINDPRIANYARPRYPT